MKTAFELALERVGGALKELSPEKKKLISEIDSRYNAKIAEVKLRTEDGLKKNPPPEEEGKIRAELSSEIERLEKKREREKDSARNQQ